MALSTSNLLCLREVLQALRHLLQCKCVQAGAVCQNNLIELFLLIQRCAKRASLLLARAPGAVLVDTPRRTETPVRGFMESTSPQGQNESILLTD